MNEFNKIIKEGRDILKDQKAFFEKVSREFTVPDKLIELWKKNSFNHEMPEDDIWPAVEIRVFLEEILSKNFKISYEHSISFSKICMVVKDDISVTVSIDDKNLEASIFTEESKVAYTKKQTQYLEEYMSILRELGYYRLSYNESNFVLCDIKYYSKDLEFFGPQPTVETMLFNDIMGHIPEELI